MKEKQEAIAAALQAVPAGRFEIRRHAAPQSSTQAPDAPLTVLTDGKGRIERFAVFDGVEVSFHQYLAERVQFRHRADDSVLEIDHCRAGRIGWSMRGAAIYLGAGDVCLHTLDRCADSEMILPLGFYEGISVTVHPRQLQAHCPEVLREAGFDVQAVCAKFSAGAAPVGLPASQTTEHIFAPLYALPDALRVPYYRLKAQEILLYLSQLEPERAPGLSQYVSQQTELIKEIRDFLVQHLDQRFTIEALSKKYLINTSSLKAVFKAVYGLPIASYMKEYRVRQAMKLLRETDDSIAMIARKVGYETQGKFTKAFKEIAQILPTEYRKFHGVSPDR